MKMPEIIDDIMLAPCGMNCTVCYKHVGIRKHSKPCEGCLKGDLGKPEHCRKCNIKSCAQEKGYVHCFECTDFPYGADTIAKRLMELGHKNKKGEVRWTASGVRGIVRNEKYKGDLLLGKTFTTDPITKRRLINMGEQNQYYIENHHEAIVSKEDWAKAGEILKMRARARTDETTGNREQFTRRYSFSSMCECSYCGSKLTRRTRHSNSIYEKPVWQCMKASKYGVANCPNSKAIDEKILEETFLESFRLLAGNFDEVLDSVIDSVEEVFRDNKDYQKKKQLDKDISEIESRKSKMTDLLIDGTIDKETYDNKLSELTEKLHTRIEKRNQLSQNIYNQKNVGKRMAELRKTLENEDSLDKFDRVVFDSVIEKVIVGGFDEEGKADPYKIIFILKGNKTRTIPNAKEHFKKMKKEGKLKKKA